MINIYLFSYISYKILCHRPYEKLFWLWSRSFPPQLYSRASSSLFFIFISAVECQEKWRNLTIVYMHKMKSPPNGAGIKKKSYYLENAMHFCLPSIKTFAPPSSGNLPPVPLSSPGKVVENAEIWEDSEPQMDSLQAFVPTQTSFPNSPVHSPFQHSNSTKNSTHINKQLIHRYSFHLPFKPRKNWFWKKKHQHQMQIILYLNILMSNEQDCRWMKQIIALKNW